MIKKGDNVIVIAGSDKGKKGTVVKAFPKTSQVVIEGVNIKKKHQKAKTSDGVGKVIDITKPVHVSNVKLAK
jgi:large subunit ribosomal protein L24